MNLFKTTVLFYLTHPYILFKKLLIVLNGLGPTFIQVEAVLAFRTCQFVFDLHENIDQTIGKAIAKIIWLQQILGIKLQSWTKPVETTLLSFTIFSNESFSSQKKKIHAPPLPVSMLFPRALSCIRKQHCTGRGRGDYCIQFTLDGQTMHRQLQSQQIIYDHGYVSLVQHCIMTFLTTTF